MFFACILCFVLKLLTGGLIDKILYTKYISMFSYVFIHADFTHLASNMLLFLLLGPALEEKYGSKKLLLMITISAFVTSLFNAIVFPHIVIMGISGIVFMFIVLNSFISKEKGNIPLTFIIIFIMYVGQEIYSGLFIQDNVSHISHILGGISGGIFGILELRNKKE